MGISQSLYEKAKKIIPGGTQLLSKRPEMFLPDLWPAYYDRAKGCEVWDMDGKKYTDMSFMGLGSCMLGYSDSDVDSAVKNAINKGSMSTLNCHEEVELAEILCKIHPWAKGVRFARTGGELATIAARIARAKTDKDIILFCGYHGWHDWYLSTNLTSTKSLEDHLIPGLNPAGVPKGLEGTSLPFAYNDTDAFLRLIKQHKNKIAAVIMEPIRNYYPEKGFLETIRRITKKHGIILIFDEITSAWRLTEGAAHLEFKIYPDMCLFAKAMSNGYPMAAVIGRKEVMEAAQDTFISSTYWTERTGFVAALATIKKLKKIKASRHLIAAGRKIQDGWRDVATRCGLDISIAGIAPLGHFSFNHDKPLALKTLFTQLMLEKGFLATTAFYASFAHKDKHIKSYLKATDESFAFISYALKKGNPEKYLKGPVCHGGFKRLT